MAHTTDGKDTGKTGAEQETLAEVIQFSNLWLKWNPMTILVLEFSHDLNCASLLWLGRLYHGTWYDAKRAVGLKWIMLW